MTIRMSHLAASAFLALTLALSASGANAQQAASGFSSGTGSNA